MKWNDTSKSQNHRLNGILRRLVGKRGMLYLLSLLTLGLILGASVKWSP